MRAATCQLLVPGTAKQSTNTTNDLNLKIVSIQTNFKNAAAAGGVTGGHKGSAWTHALQRISWVI
jgi:hypothetical protein